MYAFYADESGFSKSMKYEKEQPILVTAGILIDITKLRKAIEEFDRILLYVNQELSHSVDELKFSEIRNKYPYKIDLPKVEDRANLLERIVLDFQNNIKFKVIYCGIDNQKFYNIKKQNSILRKELKHPYLCACYKMLCRLQKHQMLKKSNKGKTFVVLDEQNLYQNAIEELLQNPIYIRGFSEVFDTAYFGKSQYSKLIQIADLIAGILRYYLWQIKQGKKSSDDYWTKRLEGIIEHLRKDIIHKECFTGTIKKIYTEIEVSI